MTKVNLDKVQFASMVDTYYNYATYSGNILLSGTIADLASATYSVTIPIGRANTRADIFVTNSNTGIKRNLANGPKSLPYQKVSTEAQPSVYVSYTVSPAIQIDIIVSNATGAPITLVNQTMVVDVVAYLIPISI